MTACVNRKHTKKVAAVVTASLVGALSLGAAPAAAMADTADTGIDLQSNASAQEIWDASTFKWNTEANEYGSYTVEPGDIFALESVTDVYGNAVSSSDYMVIYFDNAGNIVRKADAVNGQKGGMPKNGGSYIAAIVKLDGKTLKVKNVSSTADISTFVWHKQSFSVAPVSKTLDGAFAYEVNSTDASDTSDTAFTYNGSTINVAFANSDGDVLSSSDCDIQWLTTIPTTGIVDAGTYTALLTGKGAYANSQATVSFTVNKLDLSKASIVIETVNTSTGLPFSSSNILSNSKVLVDGAPVASGLLQAKLVSYTDTTGAVNGAPSVGPGTSYAAGTYLFSVSKIGGGANVTGQPVTVTAHIVSETADIYYDEGLASLFFGSGHEFETSKNEAFDPSLVYAELASGDEVPVKVTVTKDGQEVTSYDEPGEYKVVFEVATPPNCAYGAKESYTFRVVSKTIRSPKVYASVDGKAANNEQFSYTGEAVVPSIVVKDGRKVLTAGEDYTVSYRISGEKDTVDEMVEPGKYEVVVSFPGTGLPEEIVNIEITKATIQSVKPASPVVAYTGEAVKPDFIGYTGKEYTGAEVELPNSGIGVKYFKATYNAKKDAYVKGAAVSANDLKDEGYYFAEVTVNSNNDHYAGTVETTEVFQISKKAGFSDVSASAWYASPVYKARELGYVNGISGTNLFAPEADITRADAVCILFNMAGGDNALGDYQYSESTGWVTGFEDVDGHAYFAKALAWAHASGIANGYGDGAFAPYAQITREEFASMLANYAKSMGEFTAAGEGALDGMSDANTVSDWAEDNVAWAVENGVMGNGGFVAGQSNITRAEVAAMAVNYQPEAL
ncbi:hypothetical protein B5F74_11720 [Collinsella sp. An271]|uniref:S-layer homology domain-containing protein n=1 Tax=Collinsella sp. An271 TaxID=1965616 RepID=UPI000B3AAB8A|nr:S-layer homology domain-containing protein [Collinsella sp. An271]OUO57788.1 hypothetical protein B5F74_11720 [Collinsella sp. An271]